jgi:phage/plasmid-like protein (TIGR03299 family)
VYNTVVKLYCVPMTTTLLTPTTITPVAPVTRTSKLMAYQADSIALPAAPQTAAEILKLGNLDWDVEMRPLKDENDKVLNGHRAITRMDTRTVLDVAKTKYTPIGNLEGLAFLDALVDSGDAKYETAWEENGGRTVGITMRIPEGVSIFGTEDPHELYLLALLRHYNGGSMVVVATPMRLSCLNMVRAAIKGARQVVRINHTANYKQKLTAARESLQIGFTFSEKWAEEIERMINTDASDAWVEDAMKKALASEAAAEKCRELYCSSPTVNRGTRYGFYNAVTEYTQHYARVETTATRFLGGATGRAAIRAYELAVA